MRVIISGTVEKVRTYQGKNGTGFSAEVKEDGQYGRTYDCHGWGHAPSEGESVTISGELGNVRLDVYKAEVSQADDAAAYGDEIPF